MPTYTITASFHVDVDFDSQLSEEENLESAPEYQIDEDNDGQIVIYTNLRDNGNDEYVEFELEE